jgi:subtilisin-like proprotein convertase family protein
MQRKRPSHALYMALVFAMLVSLLPSGALPVQAVSAVPDASNSQWQTNLPAVAPVNSLPAAPLAADVKTGQPVIVENSDKATLAELNASATLIADYGSFSLWRVDPNRVSLLANRASLITPEGLDRIVLRGGKSINTLASENKEAQLPANLRQSKTSAEQFWLVQFAGPVKDDWLKELGANGLEVVQFLPSNAYVVWGNGAEINALEKLTANSYVQWTGAYHPDYRLDPALVSALDKGDERIFVTVQVYNTDQTQATINRLRAFGGRITKQPWAYGSLTDVSLEVPAKEIANIATWADVFNIERWVAPIRNDEAQGQIIAGNITTTPTRTIPSGPGYLNWVNSKGFPITPTLYPIISVIDDGVDNGTNTPNHPDFYRDGNPANPDRLVFNNNCTLDSSANGVAGHGNLNAGIVAAFNSKVISPHVDTNGYNRGIGISPYSRIAGVKIFNNAGSYQVTNCAGTDEGVVASSYNAGAYITTNSWGAPVGGVYNATSRAYDVLSRDASSIIPGNQQMLHIFSAGNSGSAATTIGSPGTAKNVLTVGATENVRDQGIADGCGSPAGDNADDMATFSSRGPTTDGRAKPELVAPGTHVQGPASQDPAYDGSGVCGGATNFNSPATRDPSHKYYPNPSQNAISQTLYTWSSGTSHSTPAVAGATSLIYNYYNRVINPGQIPSPAMLKALTVHTPRYINGLGAGGNLPQIGQGFGDMNMGPLFDPNLSYCVLSDQAQIFGQTGDSFSRSCRVVDQSKPVRATLVWTDAPGATTGASYVNNLDLQILLNGQVYRGNNFNAGFSVAGGSPDIRNNTENIFLAAGITGTMNIRVTAANLAGDGVPNNADTTDQDFVLIVSNATNAPAANVLLTPSGSPLIDDVPPGGNNNGRIEPGETFSLYLGLQNVGDLPATNVSSIVTVAGGVTVINNTSAYPDIAAAQIATNTTPYRFLLPAAAPCGTVLTVTQVVTYNSSLLVTRTFTINTGFISSVTYAAPIPSTDVPKAIPDAPADGVTSTVNVARTGTFDRVRVRVGNLTHSFMADLILELVSPAGTRVTLFNRRGGSGDNLVNTVFDENAPNPISAGTAPFTGSFRPEQSFAAFDGQTSNGVWSLHVRDVDPALTGTLDSWSIEFGTNNYSCQPLVIPATDLEVSGHPTTVFTGTVNSFTVRATDGNPLGTANASYTGTVQITTSDPAAVITPNNYTFQFADKGTKVFSITFNTPGTHTITATDTVSPTLEGSQSGIRVFGTPVTMEVVSGNNMSANVNTNFTDTLRVQLKDVTGSVISITGVPVVFTAPATGPSARFGGNQVITATTNASGIASSGTVQANSIAGSYVVTATTPRGPATASFNLTNTTTGCNIFQVNITTDDGSGECGTLSYALGYIQTQSLTGAVITFNLIGGGNTVTVTTALPPVPAGTIIDGGNCTGGTPRIKIVGSGVSGDGFVLSGQNTLRHLEISGFGGRELNVNGTTGNTFGPCLHIRS